MSSSIDNAQASVEEVPTQKLAILIDADNAQASIIGHILEGVKRFGEATLKRIYGDFTKNQSAPWKNKLNEHAIKPVQQFAYTSGKNATDGTMIIDAMDLLYTKRFDGFCIISSDSDFTSLAIRIREQGLTVYGFGESKTPISFRNACNEFTLTEGFKNSLAEAFPEEVFIDALKKCKANTEGNWVNLTTYHSELKKQSHDIDLTGYYGHGKMAALLKVYPNVFEVKNEVLNKTTVYYVRLKQT